MTAVGKVTKEPIRGELDAAKGARRRAALPDSQPILSARCPDAQARLFDFSIELARHDPSTQVGLQDAAETLLSVVQDELRSRSPLELRAALELAGARLWAIHAFFVLTGSHSQAKRFETELAAGEPLAVCIGTGPFWAPVAGFRKLQTVRSAHWGELHIPARGCLAVIPESTRLGGVMWRYWCDDCAPKRGQKTRSQARRHRTMVDELAERRRGWGYL